MVSPLKFSTWTAAGHALRIEYAAAVLDEIRIIAVEGYHRVPHGGVETGGILFGSQQENVVLIKAWRPIACEYAKGPSFLLSEKDEAALAETLKAFGGDAELAGMEPVGWYRAHTRSEILLSDADLAFYKRFFPQAWQVGLIVRPASFGPTRAGFFFREQDGSIQAASSYREFPLLPVGLRTESPEAAPVAKVAERVRPIGTVPEAQPVSVPAPAPVPEETPKPQPKHGWWYGVGLVALVFGALGYWLLKPSQQGLKLSATDAGGQLRISWDGAAAAASGARAGWIEFEDQGVQTHVNLTPADLRSGSIFYERLSGDVVVRLRVDRTSGQPLAEMARFLKPGENRSAPAPRLAAAKKTEVPRQPEHKAATTITSLPPWPAAAPPSTVAAAPVRTIVPFRAPVSAPRRAPAETPTIAPPKLEDVPAAAGSGFPAALGSTARAPVAPAPPPPAAAVAQSVTRAATVTPPASGRIIWTGKLAKNGRLVLERNRASTGAVTGALPAGAARVSAYPGDLTATGITLFTADPRYSQPHTEKAGAENGWNPTTYTWDPKRAAGIRVIEQPGPQNGYKLVLQSDMPKLSVLVLDWRATQ